MAPDVDRDSESDVAARPAVLIFTAPAAATPEISVATNLGGEVAAAGAGAFVRNDAEHVRMCGLPLECAHLW